MRVARLNTSVANRLAFKAIENIKEDDSKRHGSAHLHVIVDLRTFKHPVAFQELGANMLLSPISPSNELVIVWNPEVGRENLSENKQLNLARSVTCGAIDRDLKPNLEERKEVEKLLKHPPTRRLNGEERQLLWKFRFSLMSEKRALTKFLRSVD